jgi:hypothetical protein
VKDIRRLAETIQRSWVSDSSPAILAGFALKALPVLDALAVYVDMGGLEGDEELPEAIELRELLREVRSFI